jgi:hypothetical protein
MSIFGSKVLTGSVLAFIGLMTIKVLSVLVTGFVAVMSFLFFTVLPILLVGWLVIKAVKHFRREKPAYE